MRQFKTIGNLVTATAFAEARVFTYKDMGGDHAEQRYALFGGDA